MSEQLENEVAQLENEIAELKSELAKAQAQAKIDNEGNQDWINSLCEQLCKMEDALGFKNDCYDKQGKWIPTIGPWMERLRDLLATEGEVGDLKSELSALREDKARLDWAIDHPDTFKQLCHNAYMGEKEYETVRQSIGMILKGGLAQ